MTTADTLSGNLSFLNLGELIQLLGTTAASGTLRISNKFVTDAGLIFFDKGNPINAANGSLDGLEAIYSLFGWIDGRFEFVQEEISSKKLINKSRMEIILDGLRMLDEGQIEQIGSSQSQPDVSEKPSEDQQQPAAKTDTLPLIKGPLVDYTYVVDEEGFYDGDEIVQEGNHGDWIWVILEGVAEIVKDSPRGPVKMLRIGDGAFLGSVASLLAGDNVRSATVVASGNIQLGMLDSQLLASELANLSVDYKNLIKSLDVRLRQVTNTAINIYAGTKTNILTKGKKPIIKEGQNEERLFQIREGEVAVVRDTEKGVVPLTLLKKGDYFGHLRFLEVGHEPYSASVFSSPDLKIKAVDVQKMEKEHNSLSSTLKNLIEHLATSISISTLIACDYFKREK